MAAVALVGTLDTKGADFAFLAGRLRAAGADVIVVLARTTGVCGFFGASSMERLPVERALTAQVRAFTDLSIR